MIVPRCLKAIILLGLVCVALFSNQQASAQPAVQPPLVVSPAISEWVASPGEKLQKTIRVANDSDKPLPIDVVARSFDLQQPTDKKDSAVYDASQWFTVADPSFILQPRASRSVVVNLQIPAKASPGGHYATLYFREMVQSSDAPSPRAVGQVGALEFVVVKGLIKPHLTVKEPLSLIRENDKNYVNLTLHNDGNVHILPRGTVTVKDWRGRVQKTASIEKGVTLPYTNRNYRVQVDKTPVFGWWTVTADVYYSNNRIKPEDTLTTLWFLPPWQGVSLITAMIILGVLGYRTKSRWALAWRALRAKT